MYTLVTSAKEQNNGHPLMTNSVPMSSSDFKPGHEL